MQCAVGAQCLADCGPLLWAPAHHILLPQHSRHCLPLDCSAALRHNLHHPGHLGPHHIPTDCGWRHCWQKPPGRFGMLCTIIHVCHELLVVSAMLASLLHTGGVGTTHLYKHLPSMHMPFSASLSISVVTTLAFCASHSTQHTSALTACSTARNVAACIEKTTMTVMHRSALKLPVAPPTTPERFQNYLGTAMLQLRCSWQVSSGLILSLLALVV